MAEQFDWEQEGYKRLHHLECENADLQREIAYLRKLLRELSEERKWESPTVASQNVQ